jgi:hypothetical protein
LFARRIGWISILLVVLLFFSGCSGRGSTVDVPVGRNETAPPVSFTSPVSPIASPAPEQEIAPTLKVPEPESGKGTVVGVLYDQALEQPYAHQFIYLARIGEMKPQQGDGEPMLFAELDVTSDPFAQTDETGRFVIENVEPARYVIAVRLPNLQELLLYDTGTSANLFVEVEPGKIADMGVVHIMGPR